jgi:hypothetical protein
MVNSRTATVERLRKRLLELRAEILSEGDVAIEPARTDPAGHHRARPSEASGVRWRVGGRRIWEPFHVSHVKSGARTARFRPIQAAPGRTSRSVI